MNLLTLFNRPDFPFDIKLMVRVLSRLPKVIHTVLEANDRRDNNPEKILDDLDTI